MDTVHFLILCSILVVVIWLIFLTAFALDLRSKLNSIDGGI